MRRRTLVMAVTGLPRLLAASSEETDTRKHKKRRKRRKRNSVAASPTVQVAASCSGAGNLSVGTVPPQRLAQTFTPAISGALIRADLTIEKGAESVNDYFLHLSPVDNLGVPTNEVLAVASVANPDVPVGRSTVTFPIRRRLPPGCGSRWCSTVTARPGDLGGDCG